MFKEMGNSLDEILRKLDTKIKDLREDLNRVDDKIQLLILDVKNIKSDKNGK